MMQLPNDHENAGQNPTPVWRAPHFRAWEWPALAELCAMVIFAMVVLGALMGVVMQFINPHRRAKSLAQAVQKAALEQLSDEQQDPQLI